VLSLTDRITTVTVHFVETRRWDRPVATLHTTGHPISIAFHSYDQHLVVANELDMIRCVHSINHDVHGLTFATAYGIGRLENV
jgi:hypothetical protein